MRRALAHRVKIKGRFDVPCQTFIDRERCPALNDLVSVMAGAGMKTRMEILGGFFDQNDRNAFFAQEMIDGFGQIKRLPITHSIEMRNLTRRVNTRIRAARGGDFINGRFKLTHGIFECVLNGIAVFLPLPPAIGRAVIFDGEFISGHWGSLSQRLASRNLYPTHPI